MAERYPQSTTIRVPLMAYLAADHVTPATGKTIAITISKNGAAFANPSAGATNATEIGSGAYYVDLSTTDTGTLGPLYIKGTEGTIDTIITIYDVVKATTMGASALPDVAFGLAGGLASPLIRTGTLQAGSTSSTAVLDAGASATDGWYARGYLLLLTGGTGAGQAAIGKSYVGTSRTLSITPNWVTTPDATTTFQLWYLPGVIAATDYATATNLADAQNAIITEIDGQCAAIPAAVGGLTIGDGTLTLLQALQVAVSALAGKTSGAGTASIVFRNIADTLDRISATVTPATGERTATSVNVT